MTDLKRFLGLLDDFGITYKKEVGVAGPDSVERTLVTIEASGDSGPLVDGYGGFFCEWIFNDDESFYRLGIWE